MKLHSIELKNYRGIGHLVLDDIPETGVVVVYGPNEQGKSSIAEAVNLVLTRPAKTTQKAVREIIPKGSTEPAEVTVDLTLDGHRFTVDKRYTGTASGKCLVTVVSPKREEHRDKAAEDWLAERVRVAGVADLWTAFTAEQGAEPNNLDLDSVGALSQALEQRTGVEGAAIDEEALLERIRKDADRYFTPRWNYTADFTAKLKLPESLQEELGELEGQRRLLDDSVSTIEHGQHQLRELDGRIPVLKAEVDATAEKKDSARQVEEREAAARERLEAARKELSEGERAVERRETLAHAAEDRRNRHAEATDTLEKAEADSEAAQIRLSESTARSTELTEERDGLREELRQARADLETERRHAEASAARERLKRIEELEKELSAAIDHAATFTTIDLTAVTRAESDLRTAEALLEAESVTMSIRADDPREITVDGETVQVPLTRTITADTVVVIDGVEVMIAPPAESDRIGEVREAKAEFDRLLGDLESVDDARELVEAHKEAKEKVALLRQRFADASDGVDTTADAALVRQVDEAEEDIPENSGERVAGLEEKLEGVESELNIVTATRDAAKNSDILERRQRAIVAEEHSREESERADAELAAARAEASDDSLTAAVTDLNDKVSELAEVAEARAEELAEADPDGAADDHRAAVSALDDAIRAKSRWEAEVIAAETRIEGYVGIDDKIRAVADQLENAREVADTERERAEALKLLFDTLDRAREEVREAYQEPLLEKLRYLARPVFGRDVDFVLDQSLSITDRIIDGTSIPFDALSGGAQEQLDILTRLAAASLIDGGAAAPVILDDALGFTDKGRLEQMNRAITRAGRNGQVLVLTCDVDRYTRLDARREDINLLRG